MAELALPVDEATEIIASIGGRLGVAAVNSLNATVVAGEVALEEGEHTGAFPGQLLRRTQPA